MHKKFLSIYRNKTFLISFISLNIIIFFISFVLLYPTYLLQVKTKTNQTILDLKKHKLKETLISGRNRGIVESVGISNHALKELLAGNKEHEQQVLSYFEKLVKEAGASILYSMNRDGDVIISSEYEPNKSLTGNNYSFRQYFKQSIQGRNDIMMALGATTKKRGIYYSSPVFNRNLKDISGIVVLKTNVDWLDESLKELPYETVLLNSDNLVFSSSKEVNIYDKLNTQHLNNDKRIAITSQLDLDNNTKNWLLVMFIPKTGNAVLKEKVAFSLVVILIIDLIIIATISFFNNRYTVKKYNKSIYTTHETYKDIFNNINTCIVLYDCEKKIIHSINETTRKTFGLSDNNSFDICDVLQVVDEPYFIKQLAKTTTTGNSSKFDCQCKSVNGEILIFHFNMIVSKLNNQKMILINGTDITGQKIMENNLRELNKRLKQNQMLLARAEKMAGVGEIANDLANDINNNLAIIKNNLNSLNSDLYTLNEHRQYCDIILEKPDNAEAVAKARSFKAMKHLDNEFFNELNENITNINTMLSIVEDLVDKLR